MKILYLIISLFLLSTLCNSCTDKKNVSDYPEIIKQNKLETIYDSAKWVIYASNYRLKIKNCYDKDTLHVTNLVDSNIVSYDLQLDSLLIKGDTIEIDFDYYLSDKYVVCSTGGYSLDKIIFIKGDSIVYRMSSSHKYDDEFLSLIREDEKNNIWSNEYFFPYKIEQEAFPKFLQSTKHRLNPWLKAEAIKRGILKE